MIFAEDCPLHLDPIQQFQDWLAVAVAHDAIQIPEACTLSTVDLSGYPDGRIVLLRGTGEDGFVFFSNSRSQKGRSLAALPKASLTFHWEQLGYQVRIQGDVSLVSDAEADDYFESRPRMSRIGAWASDQSAAIPHRGVFDTSIQDVEARYDGQDVPRPPHWVGYRLQPIRIEFWIDRPFRLHDRFLYHRKADGAWDIQRLNP